MARLQSLVAGYSSLIPSWMSPVALAQIAASQIPPGDSAPAAATDGADRIRRLTDQATQLRNVAHRRRSEARDHLAAARQAKAAGDEENSRDEVSAARRARREAGKSDGFAAVCERRARSMLMSLLHRCGGAPVDG